MPITDKMVKNGRLSVKIQPVWTRFYGQMIQKSLFVRKIRFAYGQISKKWFFVRKFELNLGAQPRIRRNPRHHWHGFQIIIQLRTVS